MSAEAATADPPPTARERPPRLPARTVGICVAIAAVAAIVAGLLAAAAVGDGGPRTPLTPAKQVTSRSFARFDGSHGSFTDYRGQKLVVNFFSSTCVPCKKEMPTLEQAQRQLGDEVTFIGIDVRDVAEDGQALVRRAGVTYDIGLDPTGEILTDFAGAFLPTTAFVAEDGTVMKVHTGALETPELRHLIDTNLLAGG